MSDVELITWARIYFNGIPEEYRLPSDRRLAMAVCLNSVLTAEQRAELTWIRKFLEEDFIWTPKRRRKNGKKATDTQTYQQELAEDSP